MKYKFISKIHLLNLRETLNKGVIIHENIRISSSKPKVEEEFGSEFFKEMVGLLEYESLNESVYLYAIGDSKDDQLAAEPISFLNYYLKVAQVFCNTLWLIKDNSVNNEIGFLYLINDDGTPHSISSNMRTPIFTNAKGQIIETNFSREEINSVSRIMNTIFNGENLNQREVHKFLNNEASRIERFFYFLQAARTQSNLPSRIAMYCTMLETLLSTDTSEITHKIAERTARFIGSDFDERKNLYKSIKDAYAIRSSTVHGDKLRRDFRSEEKLQEISVNIDEILRKIIIKILDSTEFNKLFHTANNNELNEWFTSLTLE